MKRTRITNVGIGSLICGLGMLVLPARPVMADGFSIGGLFAGGKHGGTVIGGFLRIGEPRPQVVAQPVVVPRPVVVAPQPVIVERVWVPTPRVECRQIPVINALGRVIAYREECVTIQDGHWETVTRPAPAPVATVVVPRPDRVHVQAGAVVHRESPRYFAPPPGRVPAAPSHVRTNLWAR